MLGEKADDGMEALMLLLYVFTSCLLMKEDSRKALLRDSAFGRIVGLLFGS